MKHNMNNEKINPFKEIVKSLHGKGFNTIPLKYAEKRPILNNWTNTKLSDEEVNKFSQGFYNIGICLGKTSNLIALDFDSDIDNLHNKILKITGKSPVIKKGETGFTMFFRYNGEKSGKYSIDGEMVFEILSDGNQTVLPPSIHPSTKKPYYYLNQNTLSNTDLNSLPYLPLDFKEKIDKLFGKEIKELHKEIEYKTSVLEIEEALEYINPDSYDTWINVGMALKNYEEEDLLFLWDEWSQKGDSYNPKEIEYKWKSFKGQGLTLSTLFKLARDNGYNPQNKLKVDLSKTDEIDINLYSVDNAKKSIEKWRTEGYPVGEYIGIPEFEGSDLEARWHLRKKEVTVVTGVPNSGKSEFLSFMIFKAAETLNYKTLFFSFEDNLDKQIEGFITRKSRKRLKERSLEDETKAGKFVEDHFYFYNHTYGTNKIEEIVKICEEIKNRKGLDIVVIDPFSYLTSEYGCSEGNLDHVKKSLSELSRCCKKLDIHIFLVAHPKARSTPKTLNLKDHADFGIDLYSISGGAHFYNSCDNGMIVIRNGLNTIIKLPKIRDQLIDNTGEFKLKYNRHTRLFETCIETTENNF